MYVFYCCSIGPASSRKAKPNDGIICLVFSVDMLFNCCIAYAQPRLREGKAEQNVVAVRRYVFVLVCPASPQRKQSRTIERGDTSAR